MKDLDNISLLDIMPDSIAGDGDVKAAAAAIDKQLRAVSGATDAPAIYANLDNLTGAILDSLAVQYDVTVWRDTWADSIKRNVLKTAISDKRKKGSVYAVKNALASLGAAASISEWFEYNGEPHTFKIYVAQSEIPGHVASEVQEDVISLVDDAKPVRSHYDLIVQQPITGGLNFCGYIRAASYSRVYTNGVMQEDAAAAMGLGAYARAQVVRRLVGEVYTELPPAPPPAPQIGEIIKAYLTDEGAANTSTMWISTTDRPLYDEAGNPLLFESGYTYDILGVGRNGINGDAYLNTVSPGEQLSVWALYNFRVSSNIVFVFKVASGESFAIYALSSGYNTQGSVAIAAGSFSLLYVAGSGTPTGYSSLSGKVLRDVISGTGERLGTDGFVIEELDNGNAILRNNRAESVTVARVIFSV